MAERRQRRRSRRTKFQHVPEREPSGVWLSNLDQRTALARQLSERLAALMDDLGGRDRLSYQQRILCERIIWLEHHLRCEEEKLANGEPFDSAKWTQAVNALSGLLSKLGIERKARDVADLHSVVKSRSGKGNGNGGGNE